MDALSLGRFTLRLYKSGDFIESFIADIAWTKRLPSYLALLQPRLDLWRCPGVRWSKAEVLMCLFNISTQIGQEFDHFMRVRILPAPKRTGKRLESLICADISQK